MRVGARNQQQNVNIAKAIAGGIRHSAKLASNRSPLMSPSMPCKSSKAVVPKLEASAKLDVEANRHAATGLAIGATASCP